MSMAEDTRKRPDFSSDLSSDSARESGSDPLAELARLIGQNDPFTDISKRNARASRSTAVKARRSPGAGMAGAAGSSPDDDYADDAAAPRRAPTIAPRADYRADPSRRARHYERTPTHDRAAGCRRTPSTTPHSRTRMPAA